jgi:hypothetical protein
LAALSTDALVHAGGTTASRQMIHATTACVPAAMQLCWICQAAFNAYSRDNCHKGVWLLLLQTNMFVPRPAYGHAW